jgi:glycerol-3-phosphate acyltransferase PlsY
MSFAWALVVPAYLLGTFPSAILVGTKAGIDPTTTGSGNPGASNSYRTAGRRAGALVLLGDLGKGAAATAAGGAAGGRPLAVACGVAAVLGHVAPATRRFRGGKGVATAAGMAVVLHPLPSLVLALLWAVVAGLTRRASLGSIAFAIGLPVSAAIAGAGRAEVAALAAVGVLVIVRHHENIVRLVRGDEPPIGTPPVAQ